VHGSRAGGGTPRAAWSPAACGSPGAGPGLCSRSATRPLGLQPNAVARASAGPLVDRVEIGGQIDAGDPAAGPGEGGADVAVAFLCGAV
jgi:hypothetical protein